MPQARVLEAVEGGREAMVEFLQALVRRPSPLGHEAEAQALVRAKLEALGLQVESFEPSVAELARLPGYSPVEWEYTGRPNVVGRLPSRTRRGRSLILNGHIDVVSAEPVHHWSRDPWGGQREDGRVYGRGTADMKGGLAQMILAVEALQAAGVALDGDLIVESVIEEECTGNGTLACLARGITADGAIVAEPHALAAEIAQLGVLWLRVTVRGRGAHVLGGHRAINAIEKAYVLIRALKALETEFNREGHPAYAGVDHPVNFNVGVIRGGDWPSSVPAECVFEARIGFFPGQSVEAVERRVTEHLLEAARTDAWLVENPPAFTSYGFRAEGLVLDRNTELIRILGGSHRAIVGRELEFRATKATTDIRHFNLLYGVPAICYGPAGGNMHAPDEWVDLESVVTAAKVLAAFIMEWCGATGRT